jgi:hypothetical protein
LALLFLLSPHLQAFEPTDDAAEARHFTLKVLPLLNEKCLACHGGKPDEIEGEYDLRSRESAIQGGESGDDAIVLGDPEASPFFQAVNWDGLEMPPKENDRLSAEQIEIVRRWIAAGAPWPDADAQEKIRAQEWSVERNEDGVLVSTSGGLADEWTYRRYDEQNIWAFRPVQTKFAFGSVDEFINAPLQEAQINPAPPAEPVQLLRRAYFDLIGLPPTPEEIEQFQQAWKADAKQAWSDTIDRLLASEHYGERWGQHWLDVVRYADTGGLSNDYERSNAWRYRDYVIRSFNDDKPYNQFVVEQIAGDELAEKLKEKDASQNSALSFLNLKTVDPAELVVATGFLRMGPWETAMIPQEEARQLFRDDVVHSIGQSFLSTPMRCCKCHDHKFDPIPTRDYYRMYATISATQPAEMPASFLTEENRAGFEEGLELVESLHQFADERRLELYEKQEAAAKKWYEEHNLPYKDDNARKNDPEDQKPPRYVGLDEDEKGRLKVREQDCWIWERSKERYQELAQSVFNGPDLWQDAKKLRAPKKMNENWQPKSFIHLGGAYTAHGPEVTPGVLSGCGIPVPGAPDDDPYALTNDLSGRRLGLALWIADPRNPLTARSIVNRIWQYHFGRGISATANNFGAKGAKPTHPELLDWLTQDFLENGWTIKRMHRLIMLSDAYQRSTSHPDLEKLSTVDPDNKLLARFLPRRLTAEELRDNLLATTGELNPEVGGLPVFPEINMEVALQPRMIQFSIAPAYQPSKTPEQRNRRTIYAYRVRGQADPFLEVMNKPNPNDSCDFRDSAAVSPQAFTLLNSDIIHDRSIALAQRIQKDANTLDAQIQRAFQLALGRAASKSEQERLLEYVQEMTDYHQQAKPEPTQYPTKITRSLVEEFSGQTFEYEEWLPVFEEYTADAKAADVDAKTRALADLCLILFNTNEFVYVY